MLRLAPISPNIHRIWGRPCYELREMLHTELLRQRLRPISLALTMPIGLFLTVPRWATGDHVF